ncbi:MAG: TIGR01777 family oxidoreductase [Actinomycetes bacterium]
MVDSRQWGAAAVKVAITGSSGLLGPHLVRSFRGDGHEVVRLVRREATAADEVFWRPELGHVDLDGLAGTDAVVHLAGAGLASRPWTPAHKRRVLESRVQGTTTIAGAVVAMDPPPRVLLSMAGVGYYGNPGDRVLDETSPAGDTYLARIVQEWEAATMPAAAAGIRVVTMRTGVVVSGKGGAYGRLLPIFRLGLGGRLGSGRQWWSWVALHDYVRAVRFLVDHDELSGPVNVTSPQPVTNAEATVALGRAVHRPAVMWVPGFALRLPLRDFAEDLLGGQRVVPQRLLDAGFAFDRPELEQAIRAEIAQARATS